jgi:hypothetical protein
LYWSDPDISEAADPDISDILGIAGYWVLTDPRDRYSFYTLMVKARQDGV